MSKTFAELHSLDRAEAVLVDVPLALEERETFGPVSNFGFCSLHILGDDEPVVRSHHLEEVQRASGFTRKVP